MALNTPYDAYALEWTKDQNVRRWLQHTPKDEKTIIRQYKSSALAQVPDTFALVRILGNDLVPRHAPGQTYNNLQFILRNEQQFKNCTKLWILNRLVENKEKERIIKLLNLNNQMYLDIPFVPDEYKLIDWNFTCLPDKDFLATKKFREQPKDQKLLYHHVSLRQRLHTALYEHKNLYVMHNNGGRNLAIKYGLRFAKWVLPWDGNCFLTFQAWRLIEESVTARAHLKYFIVPMERMVDNSILLSDNYVSNPAEEPQIIFRQDATEKFNESLPYGRRPKVELFWRLGIPGRWDRYTNDTWDMARPSVSSEAGLWGVCGWVARLSSGCAHLEVQNHKEAMRNRGVARQQGIRAMIHHVDQRVHFQSSQGVSPDELIFYNESRLQQLSTMYQKTKETQSIPVLDLLLKKAATALTQGPFSVTQKTTLPPSNDIHDYWHPAPYWWPNPDTPDGMPFVRKDGQRVPGTVMYTPESEKYDRTRLQQMFDNTTTLALAFRVTGERKYAEHAASLVRVWFVDAATKMNPHLWYSQVIRGHNKHNKGKPSGIIEMKDMYYFLDAVRILTSCKALSKTDVKYLKKWLTKYLTWLNNSKQGLEECASRNNHGIYFDLQVASILAYLKRVEELREVLLRAESRILVQVDNKGLLTEEVKRTTSKHYVFFTLQAFLNVFQIACTYQCHMLALNAETRHLLTKAIGWALINSNANWPYEQISEFDMDRVCVCERLSQEFHLIPFHKTETESLLYDVQHKHVLHPHCGVQPYWALRC